MTETDRVEIHYLVALAIQTTLEAIKAEQNLVQTSLDEFDATPNWRWFRKNRILAKAKDHHECAGELLASLRSLRLSDEVNR